MLAGSFRLVTARLIPGQCRCKQALLLAVLILSGCGGSPQAEPKFRAVATSALRFDAPRGWQVTVEKNRTTARDGSQMTQVAVFPLVRAYAPSLFARVERELRTRMAALAAQTGGTVGAHRVVDADGARAHAYDLKVDGRVDTYTFVLKGKREYQLVCVADAPVCARFVASFRVL
jgi:hypothetical protein